MWEQVVTFAGLSPTFGQGEETLSAQNAIFRSRPTGLTWGSGFAEWHKIR